MYIKITVFIIAIVFSAFTAFSKESKTESEKKELLTESTVS